MSKDDDDNVIAVDFTAKPMETTLRPVRRRRSDFTRLVMGDRVISCGHPHLLIDEDTLDIECGECHERIDARLFVLEWARRERQLEWAREKLEAIRNEHAELERLVRNLKARLRRARDKAPP